jgi:hypothetical protein
MVSRLCWLAGRRPVSPYYGRKRPGLVRACDQCRRPFAARNEKHRFCSDRCRYRGRKRNEALLYGTAHRRLRQIWAPQVAAGVCCVRGVGGRSSRGTSGILGIQTIGLAGTHRSTRAAIARRRSAGVARAAASTQGSGDRGRGSSNGCRAAIQSSGIVGSEPGTAAPQARGAVRAGFRERLLSL